MGKDTCGEGAIRSEKTAGKGAQRGVSTPEPIIPRQIGLSLLEPAVEILPLASVGN